MLIQLLYFDGMTLVDRFDSFVVRGQLGLQPIFYFYYFPLQTLLLFLVDCPFFVTLALQDQVGLFQLPIGFLSGIILLLYNLLLLSQPPYVFFKLLLETCLCVL